MKIYKFNTAKICLSIFSIFSTALFLIGCQPPQTTNSVVETNTNTANISAANTNTEKKETGIKLPVTLPVLDAMLYDEDFVAQLKSKLNLTDEQIEQLKNTSREAVRNLSGGNENEEYTGSTRASAERAHQQIREILGEEKAGQLFDLVRRQWSNTDEESQAMLSQKPNTVPTDTRIVVNAPAYRMDLFRDGNLVKTYKIGIGYPEFPLPFGMRNADTIIFNPTWTPPDEPWVKGELKPGKTVEAGSKQNPLGPIKIPIGLPSLIHGGKAPARLGTFASHGCVGLTNQQIQDFSLKLAEISGTQLSDEDIKNYEKQKTETKNVKLSQPVKVELRYETIVVEDGKLKIYRDVYERGTNTEENLRRVLDNYGVSFDSLNENDRRKILDALRRMNRDASGNPIVEDAVGENKNTNSNSNANTNSNSNNANSNNKNTNNKNDNSSNQNSNSGEVTRNIKGKKEVVIELAELQGKGYPAPVDSRTNQK